LHGNLQSVLSHSQAKHAWQDRHDTQTETSGATILQPLLNSKQQSTELHRV